MVKIRKAMKGDTNLGCLIAITHSVCDYLHPDI
jgi:hypothetical protein